MVNHADAYGLPKSPKARANRPAAAALSQPALAKQEDAYGLPKTPEVRDHHRNTSQDRFPVMIEGQAVVLFPLLECLFRS
jgi:hypothetical protein